MRTVRLLFLLLVGFLTLMRAQPGPGELEEPGGEPQYTIDEIMEAIRDEQGVERDEQLEPHAVDPELLELLGDALMHKWVIVSSLRSTVEDIARRITGAGPRRQHIQLGLAYVSSKVMGILALFQGAGEPGSHELFDPEGGGGGGGGEIGEGGGEEGGGEGEEGEGEEGEGEGEGGGSGGYGGRGGGLAGIERNRGGGSAGSQSGEGSALTGRGGSAAGGAYSGRAGTRSGSGRMTLAERRASGSAGSGGSARGSYSSRSGSGGGPVGHLTTSDEEYGSEGSGVYRSGSGSGSGGSGRLSADEDGGSSARGSRSASGRRGSSSAMSGSPLGEILGETRNLSWVVVVIVLAVIGTVIATIVRIVRFFKRVKKGREPAPQPVTIAVEDSALRILKERFVRDEITRAEFEEKRRHLEELSRPAAESGPETKKRPPVVEDVGGDILAP